MVLLMYIYFEYRLTNIRRNAYFSDKMLIF